MRNYRYLVMFKIFTDEDKGMFIQSLFDDEMVESPRFLLTINEYYYYK